MNTEGLELFENKYRPIPRTVDIKKNKGFRAGDWTVYDVNNKKFVNDLQPDWYIIGCNEKLGEIYIKTDNNHNKQTIKGKFRIIYLGDY